MENTDQMMFGDNNIVEKQSQNIKSESADEDSGRESGGGWITFPFLIGTTAFLILAAFGWIANLIVFLIEEFNVKSIDAAQIFNVVNGSVSLLPVLAAIIADSFFGSFSVIFTTSCISFLGAILLTLSATIGSLRPGPCPSNISNVTSHSCDASKFQFAVLYAGIAMLSVGLGGCRFTTATMGADQFDKPEAQAIFFNWFFFTTYAASVVSFTAIVFVEDSVSWGLGFGLCAASNFIGSVIFLSGKRFYRKTKPKGSPFTGLLRVAVAAFRKRKLTLSERAEDYYHYDLLGKATIATPRNNFRFLNRAAQKTEGDTKPNEFLAKPWRLCTVQQVEDLKTIIKTLPIWSSGILLLTTISVQTSLSILQALTMDRRLANSNFKIPPGSVLVSLLLATSVSLTIIDRFLCPAWQSLTGHLPTPLQRIGLGHVLNALGMAASAIVESKRLEIFAKNPQLGSNYVPMNVLWLFPQLILVGIGKAFHFPGQVSFYYQVFPPTLRSMSSGIMGLVLGIAFYLCTALIDLIRRVTGWLPYDLNKGKLDNVYWVLVVLGVINFVYYLVCAKLYKYQTVEKEEEKI